MATLTARTVLEFSTAGREAACVLNWQAGGATPIPLYDLAYQVGGAWAASMYKPLSQECILTGVQASYLDGSGIVTVGGNFAGDISGQMLPPNNAFLLRHAVTGSSRGGRSFIPGVPVSAVFNNGVVDQPFITSLQTEWAGFQADVLAAVAESPALAILTKAGVKLVQNTTVGPTIVSQRRRMD